MSFGKGALLWLIGIPLPIKTVAGIRNPGFVAGFFLSVIKKGAQLSAYPSS